MKKLIIAGLAIAICATVSYSQETPKADVSAGYSLLYVLKGYTLAMNGGSAAATFHVNDWLGVVGDFGAYSGSPGISGLVGETYTFGPRFSYRRWSRLTPLPKPSLAGAMPTWRTEAFSAQRTHLLLAAAQAATLDWIAPANSRCAGSWNSLISVRSTTSLRIPIPVPCACRSALCFASGRSSLAIHSRDL